MYDNIEKREYKRIEILYTTRFRVKQYEGLDMSSSNWDVVNVKNLSAGGMLFNYNKYLGLGSLLDLKIDFFKSMPAINCIGRVVRIEERQPDSMFHIATEFTEINEQEKEMINTNIKNISGNRPEKINILLEKPEKMKNTMTEKVAIAEAKQKYSTTLQTKNITKKTVKKKSLPEKATTKSIGIRKEFINVCRATFRLPKSAAPDARSVYIVGDFNNWDIHADPMKKAKNGDYTIKLDLTPGREYQFRYLVDESKWENDWKADKYVKSPYGNGDNSVVIAEY
jgi:hypothetical protein